MSSKHKISAEDHICLQQDVWLLTCKIILWKKEINLDNCYLLYVHMCVHICVQLCIYVCVCTCMHTCTEARGQHWVGGVFLVCSAFYYLRQGLSLVLNSRRRPGLSVGKHQPSSLHCNHRCWLFTGSRGQNSCLRAGVGWIWFAESSSKGNFILFFVFWGRISL